MAIRIQVRRSTQAEWTAANPLLAEGELALELDTRRFKIGDGVNPWNLLDYNSAYAETINSIGDVVITSETVGQLLKFNGVFWVNDLANLSELADIEFVGIEDRQFLQYDQLNNGFKFANIPKFDKYIVSGSSVTVTKIEHGITFPSTVTVFNGDSEVSVEVRIGQLDGEVTVLSNVPLDGHRIIIE